MSDYNHGDLAQRVSDLEAKVELLVGNLRANNGDLYALVVELLPYTNVPEDKRQRFINFFEDDICPRIPPGCLAPPERK